MALGWLWVALPGLSALCLLASAFPRGWLFTAFAPRNANLRPFSGRQRVCWQGGRRLYEEARRKLAAPPAVSKLSTASVRRVSYESPRLPQLVLRMQLRLLCVTETPH